MNDKIIFLDFDGVLCIWGPDGLESKDNVKFNITNSTPLEGANPYGRKRMMHGLRPEPVENLKMILNATGADIVISSTWRECFSLDEISLHLKRYGLKFPIGCTPLEGYRRGHQIKKWIEENGFDGTYVIIDDIYDFLPEQENNIVLTNPEFGLMDEQAHMAIKILNKENL